MKKYLVVIFILFILCGCIASKNSPVKYEESKSTVIEQKKPEKSYKIDTKKLESIIYKGKNDKAEISYNLSNNILTYKLEAGNRHMLIRAGGLAGLIYINDKTYYTNYSAGKINTKGCIYDSSTKNIVVNPNAACEINMEIIVDDMPAVETITTMGYKSDLGEFVLFKK